MRVAAFKRQTLTDPLEAAADLAPTTKAQLSTAPRCTKLDTLAPEKCYPDLIGKLSGIRLSRSAVEVSEARGATCCIVTRRSALRGYIGVLKEWCKKGRSWTSITKPVGDLPSPLK